MSVYLLRFNLPLKLDFLSEVAICSIVSFPCMFKIFLYRYSFHRLNGIMLRRDPPSSFDTFPSDIFECYILVDKTD